MKSYKLPSSSLSSSVGNSAVRVTVLDYILVPEYSYQLYRVIKHREYFYCHY